MRELEPQETKLEVKRGRKSKYKIVVLSIILVAIIPILFLQSMIKALQSSEESSPGEVGEELVQDTNDEVNTNPEEFKEDWRLILVNDNNKMPEDYEVDLTYLEGGHAIDSRAYEEFEQMIEDARAEGLDPIVCSSYRSLDKQITLFNNEVNEYKSQGYTEEEAREKAGKWVAVPRTSEHQLGLALDIVARDYQLLDKSQEDTAEQQWLMANSYKYGFILRYPEDKTDITGKSYEPWHYRYVGKEAAEEITKKGICLEEYLAS